MGQRDNVWEPAPLLDALDAGGLDELLHGIEPLLVRVAEGQEAPQQVEAGAVALGADWLGLSGGLLHGRPVLHSPGILEDCGGGRE